MNDKPQEFGKAMSIWDVLDENEWALRDIFRALVPKLEPIFKAQLMDEGRLAEDAAVIKTITLKINDLDHLNLRWTNPEHDERIE